MAPGVTRQDLPLFCLRNGLTVRSCVAMRTLDDASVAQLQHSRAGNAWVELG